MYLDKKNFFDSELAFFCALWYTAIALLKATVLRSAGNRDTGGFDLRSYLHRMGVRRMKNFNFNDLMSFGMFLLALLTFIYLICH